MSYIQGFTTGGSGGSGITTINGTTGSVTGSAVTITGGTSGAVFTGSGTTLTESFNYLHCLQLHLLMVKLLLMVLRFCTLMEQIILSWAHKPEIFQ